MAIILFDEIFFNDKGYQINKNYFKILLEFIKKYSSLDVALFLPNCDISDVWSNNTIIAHLTREIQKTGHFSIYNANEVTNSELTFEVFNFSKNFIDKIVFLHNQNNEIIIFLSLENHKKDIKLLNDYIYLMNNIENEVDSNFSYLIQNGYINIIEPTINNPLPNKIFCNKFKKYQDEIVKGESVKVRQSLYYKIASEVIKRNGYITNQHISSLNPSVFGDIFSYENSDIIYASVDIEHGAIEVFDKIGKHQDEYTYEGVSQDKQDKNGYHDINV